MIKKIANLPVDEMSRNDFSDLTTSLSSILEQQTEKIILNDIDSQNLFGNFNNSKGIQNKYFSIMKRIVINLNIFIAESEVSESTDIQSTVSKHLYLILNLDRILTQYNTLLFRWNRRKVLQTAALKTLKSLR